MTTIYSRSYSENAKTLIISSTNSIDEGDSYARFGAYCTAENQKELGDIIVSVLTEIEESRGSTTHFIVSYEFLKKCYKEVYLKIKELIIDFDSIAIETVLLSVTTNAETLLPLLMAIDEESLINITYNFPVKLAMDQVQSVYYSRFFQDLESIDKECVVNG